MRRFSVVALYLVLALALLPACTKKTTNVTANVGSPSGSPVASGTPAVVQPCPVVNINVGDTTASPGGASGQGTAGQSGAGSPTCDSSSGRNVTTTAPAAEHAVTLLEAPGGLVTGPVFGQ